MRTLLVVSIVVVVAGPIQGADVEALIKQLKEGDRSTRRAAARSLLDAGSEARAAVPALARALRDPDLFVRRFAAQALGALGPDARPAVPALKAALNDSRREVQEAALAALGKIGGPGVAVLTAVVRDTRASPALRRRAAETLGEVGPEARPALPVLTEALKGGGGKGKKRPPPDSDIRVEAATALGQIARSSDREVVATLEALAADKKLGPRALKRAVNNALRQIKRRKTAPQSAD
jgi:HEAT repeat protein